MLIVWIALGTLPLLPGRNGLVRGCLYTVTPGDSVSRLAAAQGCDSKDIRDANPGIDWSSLETGRILIIPEACECPPYPECVITTSTTGAVDNNLDRVAKNRGCFTEFVQAVNGEFPVEIPSGTPVTIPTDNCRCSVDVVGCGYTAQTGDTVAGVLAKANCPESAAGSLQDLNPGLFPDWAPNMIVVPLDFIIVIPPFCDCPEGGVIPDPSTPGLSGQEEPGGEAGDSASPPSSGDSRWMTFGVAAAVSVTLLITIVVAWLLLRRKRAARQRRAVEEAIVGSGGKPVDASSRDATAAGGPDVSHTDNPHGGLGALENASLQAQSCGQTATRTATATPTMASTPLTSRAGANAGPHVVEMSWVTSSSSSRMLAGRTEARLGRFVTQSNVTTSRSFNPLLDAPLLTESPYQAAVEYLQDVLDDMNRTASLLLARWAVLSSNERRIGGQGVVQFVWDTKTRQDHVVKFFLNDKSFQREAQLYSRANVREMMAAVVHMQESGVETASGDPLPSFIVLKRGSSLDEWALKRKPDFATSLQVLMQIVDRLVNLHEAGYVHRDLKPANILWRTEDNDWTIIDFGCVADLSESSSAHLACSLPYAPPEVAEAAENDLSSIEVDPASDIWSLGIVVYELLTGDRVFPRGTPRQVVFDQLMGRAPLPWEEGAPEERRSKIKRLGLLRRAVLSCLSRVPSQRPTAQTLLRTLNSLFQGTQSKTD